jgi:hypothetical protein
VADRRRFTPEETPTGVTCLACGGDWRKESDDGAKHALSVCNWCLHGFMNKTQVATWKGRKRKP